MRRLLLPCLLLASPSVAQVTPELSTAVDTFLLDRWSNTDPAPLVAELRAANLDATALETILRAGRPTYPPVAEPRGRLSARLPLPSDHFDHTTEHYVYVPKSYDPAKPTPLVVIAHGGSAARDLDFGAKAALGGMRPFWLEAAERHGFLLVAPLSDRGWMQLGTSLLFSAIARMQRDFHIDPDRIFLTGHSMGGHATWRSAFWFTDRWAAVSPMSGGYDYVKSQDVWNLINTKGYTTFGKDEPYQINEFNRIIAAHLQERRYPWICREKDGGHEIFADEVEKVGEFFAGARRDLYRKQVWARIGGLQFASAEKNERWGQEHSWRPERPIELSTMFWLRFFAPAADVPAERRVQKAFAAVQPGNRIELVTENARRLRILLHPSMVDFGKDVTITANDKVVFQGKVTADLGAMLTLVREFDDRGRVFHAAVDVTIDGDRTVPEPRGQG
ncbi:MAG: hypothetical protein MUC36_22350 [Planctomycetes bacterium]|jgi:acetyl esterase/lipase|nr:hypothetical protein [Planctomycetota bacterium]